MSATFEDDIRPLHVDVEPHRKVVRVRPRGEVDLSTVRLLHDQINELLIAGFDRLLLDLGGVTFLDSSGLKLVVELARSASADGWQLGLLEGPPAVQRPFDVTRLRSRLPFVEATDWAWR